MYIFINSLLFYIVIIFSKNIKYSEIQQILRLAINQSLAVRRTLLRLEISLSQGERDCISLRTFSLVLNILQVFYSISSNTVLVSQS